MAIVGCLLANAALSSFAATQLPFCAKVADETCGFTASGCSNGISFAEFTLKPEPESEILCRIELPSEAKWNGELWGVGNSSEGGKMPKIKSYSADGSAVVTTDLGTKRYVFGDRRKYPIPAAIRRDFFWRATHLMTVYAKKIVRAHYGRDAAHSYFNGASCGGRQALSEAMRFPEDYDGIFAGVPATATSLSEAEGFNLYYCTHDDSGRALVTVPQMRLVADAAIEYMKDREPRPYAGKVLSNPFLSETDIEGFLALAAKRDPKLDNPDLLRRLKGIYTGHVHKGRRMCHGMSAGVFFGNKIGGRFTSDARILTRLRRRRGELKGALTWDDLEKTIETYGAEACATSPDLSKFRDRGGKIIMTTGWEDQTLPAADHVAYYESVVAAMGGYEKTQDFFRLFPLPGLAHGGGKGRIATGSGIRPRHAALLRNWVTKGVAPKAFSHLWKKEKLTIPVPPYPMMAYQDEKGKWLQRRYPENMVRMPDPAYLRSDTEPWKK